LDSFRKWFEFRSLFENVYLIETLSIEIVFFINFNKVVKKVCSKTQLLKIFNRYTKGFIIEFTAGSGVFFCPRREDPEGSGRREWVSDT
jgi:hypothetical protein